MKNLVLESQSKKPQAVGNNLVIQELKDETLVYNLVADRAICLNSTAAFVWKKCDGQTCVTEIAEQLARKTNQAVNEDIVWLTLDLLKKENLIADDNLADFDFGGMTRREIIKKVGLATMISLPMISSLVAPTAAIAASGAGGSPDGACTSNCATVNSICTCLGSLACAPGFTLGVGAAVGVCVDASAAVNAGILNVGANVNGNVCLLANACIRIQI